MPILPHTSQFIEVNVSDRIYNDTVFKQKARFTGMNVLQSTSGTVTVHVQLKVFLYADNNGAYGDIIDGRGITNYDVTLVADNNCAVDAATGEVLYVRVNEMHNTWLDSLNDKPENLMLQGDFFEMLMHSAPVEIEPMLRNYMLQADKAPFNKFA